MKNIDKKVENMNIVIVGHVDHGKSSLIGRLLADTNSLPEGKLEEIKNRCKRNSKPFEYSFLLDALKDEQSQGITIDSARCFFQSQKREYIVIDAPGHIEFLKNMVTGASRADGALLVIDAKEGVQENSKRHGYLLSMLGITQVVVVVNKMDLVGYDKEKFEAIKAEYTSFLKNIGINAKTFIPISAMAGENVAIDSDEMPWNNSGNILTVLDSLKVEGNKTDKPFRMPVQDVYKFTKGGDDRRIISGTISSGKAKVGDEIIFYPSKKKSRIKSIESFNTDIKTIAFSGMSTGFTLEEQIYIKRGEVASLVKEDSLVNMKSIMAKVFWLGQSPLKKGKTYTLKIGHKRVKGHFEKVIKTIDASTLKDKKKNYVGRHEVAQVVFTLEKEAAFDIDLVDTSRFVIIDDYNIAGGGIVEKDLTSKSINLVSKELAINNKIEIFLEIANLIFKSNHEIDIKKEIQLVEINDLKNKLRDLLKIS